MLDLTKKDIEEFLKELSVPPQREYVLYTGINGMYSFNFALGLGGTINSFVHVKEFHKGTGKIYLSLFNKSGLYKVMVVKNKDLYLYKGTTLLLHTRNVEELNKQIGKIKQVYSKPPTLLI